MARGFGQLPYGHGLFGGDNDTEDSPSASRLLQRYPTGLAFKGRNIDALERAFAAEFDSLRVRAHNAVVSDFWRDFANRELGDLSISFIEQRLSNAGFGNVKLYHTTGLRHYIQPQLSNLTYFGHGRFNEGRTTTPPAEFAAQFGEFSREGINPLNYPLGKIIENSNGDRIGQIDHLLNTTNGGDNETQGVFSMLRNSLLQNRFVYYACGGEFFSSPIIATDDELIEIKRILLASVKFGNFGILLVE
jgi:hypothetical protein